MIDRRRIRSSTMTLFFEGKVAAKDFVLFQYSGDSMEAMDPFERENHSEMPKSHSEIREISTLTSTDALLEDGLHVTPIGVVRSIYKLCVGTPRQGLLAPSARGYIDLLKLGNSSPVTSVNGLEGFSHIWIVFVFHLNTQSKGSKKIKSKIAPPALGGEKVGIYATRTPHRYNPIGMSLCKLERIETVDKRNVRIHVSGLDLVDGTPVLDIKPYVPVYDSVIGEVRVPHWVESGLCLRKPVTILESARTQLENILIQDPDTLEFFGPTYGETTIEESMEAVLECIRQVLAIDVRSSYQTEKSRQGKFQAERSSRLSGRVDPVRTLSSTGCSQQIDNLLVHFDVREVENPSTNASENSGAEDIIVVTEIERLLSC